MLRDRLWLGATLIAALVGLCYADVSLRPPGVVLLPLAVLIGWLAVGELHRMFSARGLEFPNGVACGCTAIILATAIENWRVPGHPAHGAAAAACGLAAALGWLFLSEMRRFSETSRSLERLGSGALALLYVGGSLSWLVQIRQLGADVGLAALASLVLVVKLCDTGAYFTGRFCGRHKLSPALSPGKTVEGALGGLAWSAIGSWAFFQYALPPWLQTPPPPLIATLSYGVALGLAGMVADLAESLLKRDAGVKDSSAWMPGFGGVLDVVDSLLLSAPVGWAFWASGWLVPWNQ